MGQINLSTYLMNSTPLLSLTSLNFHAAFIYHIERAKLAFQISIF